MNPACRFGAHQGGESRAVRAAIHAPVNLPTWGHSATVVRTFREGQAEESLALAGAGHRSGYRQLPVCAERKRLPPVPLRRRKSNEIRGFIPQTQLRGCRRCGTKFGAAAAALKCYAVSRVMAAMAARWHRVVCAGYFDDFAIISKGSCVQKALQALAQLHAIVGFDLKVGGPSMGLRLSFLAQRCVLVTSEAPRAPGYF